MKARNTASPLAAASEVPQTANIPVPSLTLEQARAEVARLANCRAGIEAAKKTYNELASTKQARIDAIEKEAGVAKQALRDAERTASPDIARLDQVKARIAAIDDQARKAEAKVAEAERVAAAQNARKVALA